MPAKKAKTQKKPRKKIEVKTAPALKWFMLVGFNKSNKDEVGFLALDKEHTKKNVYKMTKDATEALKFPSMNVNGLSSFGTPKQWLEFFKGEYELSGWKFHLVKAKAPNYQA